MFWVHSGLFWPTGVHEQILAGLFYLVSASGIVGYAFEHFYPRRLTQSGIEVIFAECRLSGKGVRSNQRNPPELRTG